MAGQIDVGGGYSIDIDDAKKFTDALQAQLDQLQIAQAQANRELVVFPPGHDDYSAAWANSANQMVTQHATWNQGKQQELADLIKKVNAVVEQYKQTEHDNTLRA
ncbi:PE domain-containing protein [Kutzneria sp. CA-103260]|uniref:PE domain-containing protein n=1 Tax=Kutzneria sp. CA-103260 TaxID=2802641 RepID=UPI001BA830D6|nr:PE domain-containing protein [Kutzneria sp. CA-103260]QUQ71128.1 hypothetical protein JJ691_89110 [Kutzneria sp. CA-103260]